MFNQGQKVVCVDGAFPDSVKDIYTALPVQDKVYVVRAVRVGVKADQLLMDCRRELASSLLLIGVVNPANNLGVEYGFNSDRFRALEEVQAKASAAKSDGLVETKKEVCT